MVFFKVKCFLFWIADNPLQRSSQISIFSDAINPDVVDALRVKETKKIDF